MLQLAALFGGGFGGYKLADFLSTGRRPTLIESASSENGAAESSNTKIYFYTAAAIAIFYVAAKYKVI